MTFLSPRRPRSHVAVDRHRRGVRVPARPIARWKSRPACQAGGKIAVIDTEAGRALHYADLFGFDHGDMMPLFGPGLGRGDQSRRRRGL